jgi:hypothetical protein
MRIPIVTETGQTEAGQTTRQQRERPISSSTAADGGKSGPNAEQRAQRPTLATAGAVGLAGIWISVVLISVFSPDLVSGSEQDHVPIAALLTWVWGLIASRSLAVTLVGQRDRPGRPQEVWLLVAGVTVVWAAATALAVFGP